MRLTKPFRFLLLISLISASSSGDATSPNYQNYLSKLINKISDRVVETVVSLARTQAEVTYGTVTYNPTLGSIFLNDLRVAPYVSSGLVGCVVSVGTIGFSLYRNDFSSVDNVDSGLTDVKISPLCLPLETRGVLAIAGIREIHIPAARVKLTHHYPSSATSLTFFVSLHDTASVTANADFSYLSFSEEASLSFLAKLKSAELSIINNGMWEAVLPQLPPVFTTPGLASASFAEALRDTLDSKTSYQTIENIISNLVPAIDEFLKDPKKLTIMTRIPDDEHITLSINTVNRIETIINALQPILIANYKNDFQLLPTEKLVAAVSGSTQSLTDTEILDLANLFVEGKHVPKNNEIAAKLLVDLGRRDVVEAFRMLAEIQIKTQDYESAYFNALKLSHHENSLATGLINRLEIELPLDVVILIQDRFLSTILESSFEEGIDYFDKALAHLNGSGAVKSYLGAYYFALLAKANGDVRSEFIIDKVEEISAGFSDLNLREWQEKITMIQSKATSNWLEFQLSSQIEIKE